MMHPAARPQRGVALIGFALALLALLALAALVIDLGAADAIGARLESVTDAAALEGPAGWRDPDDPTWCVLLGDPDCDPRAAWALWDAGRRRRANVRAAQVLGLGATEQPRVGPIRAARLVYDPALGDPSLRALIVDPAAPRLGEDPVLFSNPGDAAIGDMVGGTWLGATPTLVPVCGFDGRFEAFDENCRYERADFVAGEFLPEGEGRRAFLARVRLTDEETVPEVASAGGRLAVLFGRLTDSRLRQRGVAVRATSIADARPALVAGRAGAVDGLPGAAPVAVDAAFWEGVALDGEIVVAVAGGTLFAGGVPVGRVLPPPAQPRFVGDVVLADAAAGLAVDGSVAYLGLYRPAPDGAERITAFAFATLSPGAGAEEIVIRKLRGGVATGNASAASALGLRLGDAAVIDSVFQDYRRADCTDADPLALVCVAVLVR